MTAPRKCGFAAMTREQQSAIASKGGRAAHRKGTAHEFSSEEAQKAGHLGGKAVSINREHMAAIGRKGGQRTGRTTGAQKNVPAPDQYGTDADIPGTPHFKEYSQQVGDSSSVELPQWRETIVEQPPLSDEEQDGEQAQEEQVTPGVISPPFRGNPRVPDNTTIGAGRIR
jgi:general stress protein YciG